MNRDTAIYQFIEKHNITTFEYCAILTLIHYPFPIEKLSKMTSGESEYGMFGSPSIQECEVAINSLILKKIILVVNKKALDEMHKSLPKNEILEAIELPEIGDVEFTKKGGEVVIDLFKVYNWDSDIAWGSEADISPTHIRLFNTTSKNIDKDIELFVSQNKKIISSISSPKPIGPWWSRCWLRFPKGVVVDIKLTESIWDEE